MTKVCNKCLLEKSLEDFSPLANGPLGRRPSCRECQAERAKLYRAQSPDNSREATNRYRISNLDAISLKNKVYYLNNKESAIQATKDWRANNLDRVRELGRRNGNRRRARLLNNGIEAYTEAQMLLEYGETCHLCNEPIDLTASRRVGTTGWEKGLHVDHLLPIVAGGNDSLDNVRPAHGLCNIKKGKNITE